MKELLTSSDDYSVSITRDAEGGPDPRVLLLATALAIDLLFHES